MAWRSTPTMSLSQHLSASRPAVRLDFAVGGIMTRMMAQTVGILFKRFEWMLNVPEIDPARTGSHSAGIDATHDLVEVGLSDAAMMRQAGWRTPRMVGMYARASKGKHC